MAWTGNTIAVGDEVGHTLVSATPLPVTAVSGVPTDHLMTIAFAD
jgi:hypothetical protein